MQGSGLSFDHVSKLTIKFTTVNKPKRSYIKSSDWLKCKNSILNLKIIDEGCFQHEKP